MSEHVVCPMCDHFEDESYHFNVCRLGQAEFAVAVLAQFIKFLLGDTVPPPKVARVMRAYGHEPPRPRPPYDEMAG